MSNYARVKATDLIKLERRLRKEETQSWREPMKTEREIRLYAEHVGLIVHKRGNVFTLCERYEEKKRLGEYRSLVALNRAIERYCDEWLRANPDPDQDNYPRVR